MDANKAQISTSLELALLSREFPDRLLLKEAIKEDPQIIAAFDLLKDASVGAREGAQPAREGGMLSTYDKALLPGTVTASVPSSE